MEKIAIIGMGISGMAVVSAYAKEVHPDKVEIDCYDRDESFGRGYPFREDSDELLLNLRVDNISFDYENLNDFKQWLENKGVLYSEYVPRHIFGLYTQDRLKEAMKSINANKITVGVRRLDWIQSKSKWTLETELGEIKLYDRVHLCCGELPQIDPFNLSGYEKYIESVYPTNTKLSPIRTKDTVCIIGTSLTAVDVARYLLVERDIKKLYMFSRGNIIPTIRLKQVDLQVNTLTYDKCLDIIEAGNGLIPFEKFEALLNEELETHSLNYKALMDKYTPGIKSLKMSIEEPKNLSKIQTLLSQLTPTLNRVWLAFTETDRNKFTEKYDDLIQLFGNPLPMPTGKILIEASDSNRLAILDNVSDIVFNDEDASFHLLSESKKSISVVGKADFVCNATGLDTSLKTLSRKNTFIGKMLDHRYLQVDNAGGITVLPEHITVLSPRFGELNTLHAHGVLISGVQLRNNSTTVIQRTAQDLIKKLY